ncbi:RnfH family protein [Solemya pervernicosa gill symbiont]|uniref:UPF0125 protein BOW53_02665 n=2 Tax=Gammaproteobacteria incertae sedis TaxID=118884 RepID=A0A1T2L9Y6_9GAMM|nr:RnfH family protein [Candidatus Reidiella endopervernicosa]OOZ41756.1 RnfH family protein [Solemya pervernicosa gill symbiont]QKQ26457.1 RnfH family protein [Candidatus Reidiella endopervernicosa]
MENVEKIPVEVAYALPDEQVIVTLEVEVDCTLEGAIERSGLLQRYPEIDLAVNKVGVFGKLGKLANPLRAGDRVEIYRKLIADPKEVRKQRAAAGKKMSKGARETPAEK